MDMKGILHDLFSGLVHWALLMVVLLVLAGFSAIARADTVTWTWTNPTTNTNSSAIPATGAGSLVSWRFEYGTCSAPGIFGTKVGEFTRTRATNGPALTTTTNNLDPGTTCSRGYVTNTYGVESDVSNVTATVVPPPKPGPIQLVTVTLAIRIESDSPIRVAVAAPVTTVSP